MIRVLAAVLWALGGAQTPPQDHSGANLRRTPVVEVFERTHGAVVNISSTRTVQGRRSASPFDLFFEDFQEFFGRSWHTRKTISVGSGFVIHPTGYVVTNAHVVDRTTDVTITFDDQQAYAAQIVATDREQDLALLKITVPVRVPTIKLGRSDDLMVGETVIAIGNPLGYQHTLTTGVISATNRDLEFADDKTGQPVVHADLIQTDASINPGSSGGPLLNVLGELIGVNTAIRSDAQNIGFAIPADRLKQVLPAMLRAEQRNRFSLGFDISERREVVEIRDGSPAARAGIRLGDVVTQIDDHPVNTQLEYYLEMIGHNPGDAVLLELEQAGQRRAARLRVEVPPKPDGRQLALHKLGLLLDPLTAVSAGRMGIDIGTGLVVSVVRPGGPAARVGVTPGDILTVLDRYYVSDLNEVGQILEGYRSGDRLYIRILRVEGNIIYRDGTYLIVG